MHHLEKHTWLNFIVKSVGLNFQHFQCVLTAFKHGQTKSMSMKDGAPFEQTNCPVFWLIFSTKVLGLIFQQFYFTTHIRVQSVSGKAEVPDDKLITYIRDSFYCKQISNIELLNE